MKPYTILFFLLFPFLLAMGGKGETLRYDDGKQDSKKSFPNSGHGVLFERPSKEFKITEVQLFGSLYGGSHVESEIFQIFICDASLNPLATSEANLGLFRRGKAAWVKVEVTPFSPPEKFYVLVDFYAHATKGVYLGIDADSKGHSVTGLPGKVGGTMDSGDWMIRVRGSKKVKQEMVPVLDPDTEMELSYDDGEMDTIKSMAGNGHAVEFAAPKKGEWYLDTVAIHGSRYGGKYNPSRTLFTVYVCDKRMRVLGQASQPYSLFPFGRTPAWVYVDVPKIKVKGKFYVLACFNPTSTKGIFVSIDTSVKKSHSLNALPGKIYGKLGSKQEWMIRASIKQKDEWGAEKKKEEVKTPVKTDEVDAMQIAQWKEELALFEKNEDAAGVKKLLREIGKKDKDEAKANGKILVTDHVWVKYVNIPDSYAKAVGALYEACQTILKEKLGIENGFCVIPGKRLHVHLIANKDRNLQLWTSPGSRDFPLVVNTMPTWKRGLSPPSEGGPHILYGLCHELGHVLMGWKDSRHQWAHYLGSILLDEAAVMLGDKIWPKAYDWKAEGMDRFMKQIKDAAPDRGSDPGTGRIYYEVGNKFGINIWGKALPWIKKNRKGEPFHATRMYYLDDLKDALLDVGCEASQVKELFDV